MSLDAEEVQLIYEDRLLTGSVAGEQLELRIELPVSAGSARGSYGNDAISATWSIASNYNAVEQPASLEARFIDEVVTLSSTMKLAAPNHPRLLGADVVGAVGNDPVSVHVSPGTDQWSSVILDGRFGTVTIALMAAAEYPVATIRGAVDGEQVELIATRLQINQRILRIEGRWRGPASLCVLAATALAYFV